MNGEGTGVKWVDTQPRSRRVAALFWRRIEASVGCERAAPFLCDRWRPQRLPMLLSNVHPQSRTVTQRHRDTTPLLVAGTDGLAATSGEQFHVVPNANFPTLNHVAIQRQLALEFFCDAS